MTPELRAWYEGKRVFVTGHTGFKGSWLTAWLRSAGAVVVGYSLAPPDDRPTLFTAADVGDGVESVLADIRDRAALERALRTSAPELVFHLAAQSLVRRSYREPAATYEANVMGTVNVLDLARDVPAIRGVVVVTSDKCYESRPPAHAYREDEPMGGRDPYSSSKGCAELVTSAMRRSFFETEAAVASVRAGNVIGGGDWAEDRLVPDLMRGAAAGVPVTIRHPHATRPWQFVLEPLRGYLMLGRALVEGGHDFAEAWNFGPNELDAVTVNEVTQRLRKAWPRVDVRLEEDASGPHEATTLELDCTKARTRLGWEPVLTLDEAVDLTCGWYRAFHEDPTAAAGLVQDQLHEYEARVDERSTGDVNESVRVPYGQTVHGEEEIAAVTHVLRTSTQMGVHVRDFESGSLLCSQKRTGSWSTRGRAPTISRSSYSGFRPGRR